MITLDDFMKVEFRVGEIVEVNPFPEARKPMYQLKVDFGDFGIKNCAAQLTKSYQPKDLLNQQFIFVTNLSPRQIGPFLSEVLITGLDLDEEGHLSLIKPDQKVTNGVKLS